ncbi:hypothetical protein BVRB_8g198050 [Beta vulgaris subsp. vulgaris]|nr:hypothetical protein BVRB_8g198050 [Beta vulgaris subsp. vulgaris]
MHNAYTHTLISHVFLSFSMSFVFFFTVSANLFM